MHFVETLVVAITIGLSSFAMAQTATKSPQECVAAAASSELFEIRSSN